jgi:hypothetical protein
MRKLRGRVKALVDDVLAPQLREFPEAGVTLAVDMWERSAPRKAKKGSTVNDQFVERARTSALTLVLILDELRGGTREELDAAIAEDEVEVAVVLFSPPSGTSPKKLAKREKDIRRLRDQVLYDQCDRGPNSDAAWLAITRVVTYFALAALRSSELERRGTPWEVR